MSKDDPLRERRLAEALRANLRRRKAHGRLAADDGETDDAATPSPATPPRSPT